MRLFTYIPPYEGIPGLINEITHLRGLTPGAFLAVAQGTWSSPKHEPTAPSPIFDRVRLFFKEKVEEIQPKVEWSVQSWANSMGPQDSLNWHNHIDRTPGDPPEPNVFSGIYYVTRGGSSTMFHNGWVIKPEPGKLVIFSSGLRHMVPPHEGDTERLTLAFNARPEEK